MAHGVHCSYIFIFIHRKVANKQQKRTKQQQQFNYQHHMAHRSKISDDGCLTIRLAIADRTYFDSNVQFLYWMF